MIVQLAGNVLCHILQTLCPEFLGLSSSER
jgi:hypothetical protein